MISFKEFMEMDITNRRNYQGVVFDEIDEIKNYTTYENLNANGRAWSEDKDGNILYEGFIKNGIRDGVAKDYRIAGKVYFLEYKNGILLRQTEKEIDKKD